VSRKTGGEARESGQRWWNEDGANVHRERLAPVNESETPTRRGNRTAPPTVLCAGMAVVDFMFRVDRFPTPSTKTMAREFFLTSGGNAANAAIAITRLGGRARFCGPVGDDEFGELVLDSLVKERVDICGAERVEGATTSVSGIFVDPAGERLLTTRRAQGLERAPPPDAATRIIAGIDAVLADNHLPNLVLPICRAARERNIPVVLDVDKPATEAADPLLALASHAIFSAEALRAATALSDLPAALERARMFCPGFIAATDGANGVLWHDGMEARRQEAFAVSVVDTLAAGDVFHAAFALALAEGRREAEALRFAGAAAALKCTRFGGILGAPARAEVDQLLHNVG
jgi:sulfofructose kinase